MWSPPYSPDRPALERMVDEALEQGHRLGLEDVQILDYLKLCEDLKAKPPSLQDLEISVASLLESRHDLYLRLLGLEELGYVSVEHSSERAPGGQETLVGGYRLAERGRAVVTVVPAVGDVGNRLRPSSLA